MILFYPFVVCVLFLLDMYFYLLYLILISEGNSPLKCTEQKQSNEIRRTHGAIVLCK